MSNTKGYMPVIENIYFSADFTGNFSFEKLYHELMSPSLQNLKIKSFKDDVFLFENVEVMSAGIGRYPYGLYVKDMFRIYFAETWTDNYPCYIIVSAQFLHTYKVVEVMSIIQDYLKKILFMFFPNDLQVNFLFKLSRVDICNHTVKIDMDKYITVNEFFSRVSTRLAKVFPVIERKGEGKQEVSYFRYGKGDFCVRFYNKTKEVVEQKYKPFFFQKWFDEGLINSTTKKIYENMYKLKGHYRVDYCFSNIIMNVNEDDLNGDIIDIVRIYNDVSITNAEKIDIFESYIKENKIKLCKEVTNVEFQLRSDFLKTIHIIDVSSGEYFDFTDLEVLFSNANVLYNYLTTSLFRVVDRKSKAKRIRDKTTDPIWEEIQKCKILNIDSSYEIKKAELYRQYNENMNKFITVRDTLKKIVHLEYMCCENFNSKTIDNISIDDILKNVKSEVSLNENYFNYRYLLSKQLKYYGQKGLEPVRNSIDLSYIDSEYVREYINKCKADQLDIINSKLLNFNETVIF